MKIFPKPYRGAGVLFWHRNLNGELEILLAQRRAGWRWWSIPGGNMESKDGNDFLTSARRETEEEFGQPPDAPSLLDLMGTSVLRLRLLRFCWNTYLCELRAKPDERAFPNPNARDYSSEFWRHRWFKFRFGALPWRLHPMMYLALWKLLFVLRKPPASDSLPSTFADPVALRETESLQVEGRRPERLPSAESKE